LWLIDNFLQIQPFYWSIIASSLLWFVFITSYVIFVVDLSIKYYDSMANESWWRWRNYGVTKRLNVPENVVSPNTHCWVNNQTLVLKNVIIQNNSKKNCQPEYSATEYSATTAKMEYLVDHWTFLKDISYDNLTRYG